MNRLGMHSIKELTLCSVEEMLRKEFGVIGEEIHQHANGIDYSRISDVYIPSSRSFGKSQVLSRHYTNRKEVELLLSELLDMCVSLTDGSNSGLNRSFIDWLQQTNKGRLLQAKENGKSFKLKSRYLYILFNCLTV
ncbi:hypothetical protein [Priestia megaterium]|uniref:hypothetical protein n=1 Tax=Priestia megaterium TaxID=1404 RepID=UPI002159D5E1|nr:hypothetical protein [Priestia megaterium]